MWTTAQATSWQDLFFSKKVTSTAFQALGDLESGELAIRENNTSSLASIFCLILLSRRKCGYFSKAFSVHEKYFSSKTLSLSLDKNSLFRKFKMCSWKLMESPRILATCLTQWGRHEPESSTLNQCALTCVLWIISIRCHSEIHPDSQNDHLWSRIRLLTTAGRLKAHQPIFHSAPEVGGTQRWLGKQWSSWTVHCANKAKEDVWFQ